MDHKLKMKMLDYERFIMTLIVLNCYLYMGAIITTYLQPSSNNQILFYLTVALIGVTALLIYKYKKIKDILEENEQI